MKAEFKKTRAAGGLPLTVGKMYDVLDVRAGRKAWQLKEIKVKNDLGKERWYKAGNFKLFAEASEYLKEPPDAGAGQGAAQMATPDGSQIYTGIDWANAADMAAGFTVREMLRSGQLVHKGLTDGLKQETEKNMIEYGV